MKILYVTTVAITMGFFPTHIKMLQDAGHTVELACNLTEPVPEKVAALGCAQHHIPCSRAPFSKDNLTAYQRLKKLLAENHYDIVHTHTPNASALVRLACRKMRKDGLRVFYTAHGFHFYTGAPLKNWLIYYPVERFLSRWTDVLITMNQEDRVRAETFHAGKTAFIHGIGLNVGRFDLGWDRARREEKRNELGIGRGEKLLLSVGELSHRKNHIVVLQALAKLQRSNVKYLICGEGPLRRYLQEQIRALELERQVELLGTRRDVAQLNQAADLYVFPSLQEGLPVALMEAMAGGKPVICSDIRGNRDLIEDGKGGLLRVPHSVEDWQAALDLLLGSSERRAAMGRHNQSAVRGFSEKQVLEELRAIYGLEEENNGTGGQEAPAEGQTMAP